jgi:hypothetical protein
MTSTYVETKVISLNSDFATIKRNGSFLSDCVFELGSVLQDHHDIVHREITLSRAQIPVSFYIVNYTNEKIVLNNVTIDIPTGNYNSTTLASTLVSLIQTALGITMTITISKITGKFTFSASVPFTFKSASSDQIIGFSGSDLVGNLSGGVYSAIAPFPCNLIGITQLNISSTLLNGQNFLSSGQSSLLGTVTVNTGAFGLILYNSVLPISITNRDIDSIDIQIKDNQNQFVNFNNCHWTMTILVHLTRTIDLGIPRTRLSDLISGQSPQITDMSPKQTTIQNPEIQPKPKTQDEEDLAILTNNE